jgi:hypothetical protein
MYVVTQPLILTLATIVNVCTAYEHVEIRTFIRAFYTTVVNYMTWPTMDQWFS